MPTAVSLEKSYVDAWRALAGATTALAGRLELAFAAEDLPPLPWYEILEGLSSAEEQSMRMGQLAELLPISKGGMTKLVDRITAAGLVERRACPTDRRVSYVAITEAGRDTLGRMQPIYEAGISAHLASHFSPEEAEELALALTPIRSSACDGVAAACDEAEIG